MAAAKKKEDKKAPRKRPFKSEEKSTRKKEITKSVYILEAKHS